MDILALQSVQSDQSHTYSSFGKLSASLAGQKKSQARETSAGLPVGLVPSVVCEREASVEEAASPPSSELLDQEADRWKRKFLVMEPESCPTTCASAIKPHDPRTFPNLSVLLKIACTLPVTSCECERSYSVLRRL